MKTSILAMAGALLFGTTASASILTYNAVLLGANENPPTVVPGTGFALITIDTVLQTMEVQVTFQGLTVGGATGAHIHCCEATPGSNVNQPVATITPAFTGFPLGATSGTYDHVFDLTLSSTYNNPSFLNAHGGTVASEEAALLAGLANEEAYLNIHTSTNPGGEIRGLLLAPEPGTFLLAGAMLAAVTLWVAVRRRRSTSDCRA